MKHRFFFPFLLAAGLLLVAAGLAGLFFAPDLLQYAFQPPASRDISLSALLDQTRTALKDNFPLLTLHGRKDGATLTANSVSVNDISLYLAGSGYSELYPRNFFAGRPVSAADSEQNARVIVLDRETAFTLFGDSDPLGQPVTLGDTVLEVIGVADHSRSLGETGRFAAWVPLDLLTDCDLLVLSAPGTRDASLQAVFRAGAAEAFGPGNLISLSREKTGAAIPLRFVLLVLAVWLLRRALKSLGRFGSACLRRVRERQKQVYFSRLFPYALLQMLPVVLLLMLAVGAGFGLAMLAIEPVHIFPDWIPESLGDLSAWVSRFWDLVSAAARPVSLQTPELASLRFYAVLIRWGLLFSLLGGIRILLVRGRNRDTR